MFMMPTECIDKKVLVLAKKAFTNIMFCCIHEYLDVNVVMCIHTVFHGGICVCPSFCYIEHASHGVRIC